MCITGTRNISIHKVAVGPYDRLIHYHKFQLKGFAHKIGISLFYNYTLTHIPLVPYICVSELGQRWIR